MFVPRLPCGPYCVPRVSVVRMNVLMMTQHNCQGNAWPKWSLRAKNFERCSNPGVQWAENLFNHDQTTLNKQELLSHLTFRQACSRQQWITWLVAPAAEPCGVQSETKIFALVISRQKTTEAPDTLDIVYLFCSFADVRYA